MTTYKYKNGSWGPGRVEHFTGVEGLGAWGPGPGCLQLYMLGALAPHCVACLAPGAILGACALLFFFVLHALPRTVWHALPRIVLHALPIPWVGQAASRHCHCSCYCY